jgi:TRAP-type C4-dicarboxylate transport system permease small subunit
MNAWSAFEQKMCKALLLLSGLTLAFMLLFTLANVILRAFGKPIVGDFEIISFLGAVVVGFAIPFTSLVKAHVIVDIMLEKVPKRFGDRMQVATRIVAIALFLWIAWNFVVMSVDLIKSHEVTPVFRLPYYPISFGLAFSCLIQCVVLISQIMKLAGGRDG